MNKRVLKTMIYLCWAFLLAYALLKTVWADKFAIVISNENIIRIGAYIDSHIWLQQIVHFIFTCLTYNFYLCACCKKWHLSIKEYILTLIAIIPNQVITFYFPLIGSSLAFVIMFGLPYFLKSNYKDVVIIFTAHTIGQLLISVIRSKDIIYIDNNTLTMLVMGIDQYIWLILYYLYSNIYKESIMGTFSPPLWGKMNKQVKREIEKLDKKIAVESDAEKVQKLLEKKAEYEKMLAEDNGKN